MNTSAVHPDYWVPGINLGMGHNYVDLTKNTIYWIMCGSQEVEIKRVDVSSVYDFKGSD